MTKIEWANRTWNPVTGCTRVSESCDHCYMCSASTTFAGSVNYSCRFTPCF